MGELEQKSAEETDEIEWNVDTEVHLLFSMVGHKPVGINKYFQMACIWNKFTSSINKNVSSEAIWKRLETMYDLATLDEAEVIPFPNDDRDFFLPEDEFSELMHEKLRSVKRENPKPETLDQNTTASNSSTSSSDTGAPSMGGFRTTASEIAMTSLFAETIETATSPTDETSLSSILSAMRKGEGVEADSTPEAAFFTEQRPATPNETSSKKNASSSSSGGKHQQHKTFKDKDQNLANVGAATLLPTLQKKERKISVTKLQQKEESSKKGGNETGSQKEGGAIKKNKKGSTNTSLGGGDEASLWKKDKEDGGSGGGKRANTPTMASKKNIVTGEEKSSSKKQPSSIFSDDGMTTPTKKGSGSVGGGEYEGAGKKETAGNKRTVMPSEDSIGNSSTGGIGSSKKDKSSGRKDGVDSNAGKRAEDKLKDEMLTKKEENKREGTVKKDFANKSRKSEGAGNKSKNKDRDESGSMTVKKRESLGKKEKKLSDNKEKVSSSDRGGGSANFDRNTPGPEGKKRGGGGVESSILPSSSTDGRKPADADRKGGGGEKSGGGASKARKDKRSMDNQSDSDSSAGPAVKKDRSRESTVKSSAGGDSAGEEGASSTPVQTNKRQSGVKRPTRNTNTPELSTPNKRRRL